MEKSDNENVSENDDDKDEDFDIKDYRDDVDSDESFEGYDDDLENQAASGDESEGDREYTGPILKGVHRFDRKLVCVRYPGVVINSEKALETLGGIAAISTALGAHNRRLELRFRPDDGFCKPACGDRHQTAGFLLRIRIKKSTARQMTDEIEKSEKNLAFRGPYDVETLERMLGTLGKKIYSSDSESDNENLEKNNDDCSSNDETVKVPKIPEREIKLDGKKLTKNLEPSENNDREEKIENVFFSLDENYEIPKLKVIGRVETEYKFQNLCDFQYLPIAKSPNDEKIDECIYDSVYPTEIPSYRWLKNKVPYFLPPPAFSRMDSVQQYSLKTETEKGPENVIGKTRKRRAGFSNVIHFSSPETPTLPPPGIETARKIKFLQQYHLERMKKIFDERPIWSKNGLMCVTNFTSEQLKILLPSVAYYFITGPWRIMWVRLGYDPRKDPQAKIYQTLDYRLKAMHGLQSTVKCKRTTTEHTLPYKTAQSAKPKTTVLTNIIDEGEIQTTEPENNESNYIYRDGIVPPSRQMFYQYCDVHVHEIQEMLAKLPNDLPGLKCHERRGWLPSGFSDQCREIINRQVRAVLRKQMNIPEDHPTALPKLRNRKNLRFGKTSIGKSKKNSKASSSRKKTE